jgi:hypothetical protein
MFARTKQGNANGPACLGKLPSNDKTVTTIVAGATQD